jgi:hypothetical protein
MVPVLLSLALIAPNADAQPGDYRKAKKAAKLAVSNLSAVKKFSSRLSGAQAEKFRQNAVRMGLPDQDGDGVADVLEEVDGTDACNANSDGQHGDGALRRRVAEISDLGDLSITVDDIDFVLDGSTVFLGLTQDDLDIGVCVEARGYENDNGDVIASEISASDNCYDSSPWGSSSPFQGDRGPGGRRGGRE